MDIIYKNSDSVMLYQGDCVETMRTLPDNSIDSIVTDPPYELGFMGKSWDSTGIANSVEMWKECLRVLKPGGHLLSFGGTRTYHRMACAIEDAGFEIRDQMQWLYGSGFPKSMDISKQIDKQAGVERQVIGVKPGHEEFAGRTTKGHLDFKGATDGFDRPWMHDDAKREAYHMLTAPATEQSKQWDGWGTCLKPAHEPICLARKPIEEKTIAENVLKWGTGGLNIDACRIPTNETITNHSRGAESAISKGKYGDSKKQETHQTRGQEDGRFPANIILDEEAGRLLDEQSGMSKSTGGQTNNALRSNQRIYGKGVDKIELRDPGFGDIGGASRFFYCAKTSKSERNAGLNGMDKKTAGSLNFRNPSASGRSEDAPSVAAMGGLTKAQENHHPTVKPVKLMEYLVKLITPPCGTVLDPFMGSGSTGIAAKNLGFKFIGIEMDEGYCEIAEKRIAFVKDDKQLSILDAI